LIEGRRAAFLAAILALGAGACMPPSWAANALLHPSRRPMTRQPARPFDAVDFEGAGVKLKGWWFHAANPRGTIVILHGVADNRGSSVGVADHFLARGHDVIAYDSRAHGESGGDVCTYGFYEKEDLRRVLDRVAARPVVLMGFSMGAAVALQEAASDSRIGAIVAVSPFSDLRTAASERAPFFASKGNLADAFKIAEEQGKFRADDVSPMAAAAHITTPTLIVHGDHDDETPPDHARRVFAALHEPKRLILVPGADHNHVIDAGVWRDIDAWLDAALASRAPAAQ
jgi:alpha-beta hydrolase superfamily lysophospholipase